MSTKAQTMTVEAKCKIIAYDSNGGFHREYYTGLHVRDALWIVSQWSAKRFDPENRRGGRRINVQVVVTHEACTGEPVADELVLYEKTFDFD